jgi:hypothetical protein
MAGNGLVCIGDVHGDVAGLEAVLRGIVSEYRGHGLPLPEVVQVGDMGYGFDAGVDAGLDGLVGYEGLRWGFIRGNHDDPGICRKKGHYWGDWGYREIEGVGGVLWVGGGSSVDRALRVEGVDWWAGEEMGYGELEAIFLEGLHKQPEVVITHESPWVGVPERVREGSRYVRSRTGAWCDMFLGEWEPRVWVHGHHHVGGVGRVGRCEVVGLGILGTYRVG